MNVVLVLLIGLAVGFAARRQAPLRLGLLAALLTGTLGALLGVFLFSGLGAFARGLFGTMLTATVGAVLLLLLAGLTHRTTRSAD